MSLVVTIARVGVANVATGRNVKDINCKTFLEEQKNITFANLAKMQKLTWCITFIQLAKRPKKTLKNLIKLSKTILHS